MITGALIEIANTIIEAILSVFPTSSGFPSDVQTAFTYLGGYVGMLDPLIPIDTLGTVVGIVLTVELIIFSFRAITWIFSKIPVVGK